MAEQLPETGFEAREYEIKCLRADLSAAQSRIVGLKSS